MRFILKKNYFGRKILPKKRGLFGGKMKSMEEINELNAKIKQHEAAELEQVESSIDEALKTL